MANDSNQNSAPKPTTIHSSALDTSWGKSELARIQGRAKELRDGKATGLQIATYLSDQMDGLIVKLVESRVAPLTEDQQAKLKQNSCVIAVGGTGRGELAPYSDIDLLFLYDKKVARSFSDLTSDVVRDCWDCNFKLGQSLHTIADAITMAKQETQFATSIVESRLLWGSEDLIAKFQRRVRRNLFNPRLKQFVLSCIDSRNEERQEQGSTTKQLEPDVKRSLGGLRDLHLIRWIAFAHYGIKDIDALRSRGIINGRDAKALQNALEFLMRVRIDMHLNIGRPHDVLTRDEQLRIARERGITDTPAQRDVERFMQTYLQHASEVAQISENFARRHIPGSLVQRTVARLTARRIDQYFMRSTIGIDVYPDKREEVCSDLERLLDLYVYCLRYNLEPVPELVETIRVTTADMKLEMTHAGGRAFRRILRERGDLGRVLRSMYRSGVLELVIPDMTHIKGLLQFNQYHHFTVDEHTLRAVEAVRDFETDPGPVGDAWRNAKHKATLTLAVLLHDIGKGYDEDHSKVGARIARTVSDAWQMSDNKANMLEFLVLKHLKMSHLAFRRDISDPKLLSEFAHEVGRPELLKMLYILTAADIQAVGPGTWTDWKAGLLDELYNRTMMLLGGAPVGQVENRLRDDVNERVTKLLGIPANSDEAENHPMLTQLKKFPTHYLVDKSADDLVADLKAVDELRSEQIQVDGRYNDENKTVEYRVITSGEASHGCFHRIAGALTANRMAIVSAKICTTDNDIVVDNFSVTDNDFAGGIPEHRIEAVCEKLRTALRRETSIEEMFRTGQRYDAKGNTGPISDLPTRVVVDNDASKKYSIIDVFAHDQPGLLYMVTRTIHRMNLSVCLAKIATNLDQVLDVFYVTDLEGNKIPDDQVAKVQEILLNELNAYSEVQKSISSM